jgi:hypothetical protein
MIDILSSDSTGHTDRAYTRCAQVHQRSITSFAFAEQTLCISRLTHLVAIVHS